MQKYEMVFSWYWMLSIWHNSTQILFSLLLKYQERWNDVCVDLCHQMENTYQYFSDKIWTFASLCILYHVVHDKKYLSKKTNNFNDCLVLLNSDYFNKGKNEKNTKRMPKHFWSNINQKILIKMKKRILLQARKD